MKFLKKYRWRIAWFALWAFIIFYFTPRQDDFYLRSDKEHFSGVSQRFFLFLEVAVLSFLIIWFILKIEATGILQRTGAVLQATLLSAIYLAWFFVFFHDAATAVGLFINRQASRSTIRRTYVVGYFDGDTTRASNLGLHDLATKGFETNDTLSRSVYRIRPHIGDTLQVDLKKGLLNIPYIDSFTFRKKPPAR